MASKLLERGARPRCLVVGTRKGREEAEQDWSIEIAHHEIWIDPENCICCGACVPACPADAIFEEEDVPPEHHDSIAENAWFFSQR